MIRNFFPFRLWERFRHFGTAILSGNRKLVCIHSTIAVFQVHWTIYSHNLSLKVTLLFQNFLVLTLFIYLSVFVYWSGNLWINIQSTSYGKKEILSLRHTFIFPFWHIHIPILVSRMETRKFFRFTEWNPEIFPIYIMEPGNFSGLRKGNWNLLCLGNETVCRIETWVFPEFRNRVPEISGLHSINQEKIKVT